MLFVDGYILPYSDILDSFYDEVVVKLPPSWWTNATKMVLHLKDYDQSELRLIRGKLGAIYEYVYQTQKRRSLTLLKAALVHMKKIQR